MQLMGRHERHKSEISEKLISKALKYDNNIIKSIIEENYIELSEDIVDHIKEDYPNIESVEQTGNSYESIGDIKLQTENKTIFIEVKITESGGTLGNITGDALTKYGIIKNSKSWSTYREDNNHYTWVREYLDRYDYLPEVRDDDTKTSIYDKASHLKKKIECKGQNTEKVAHKVINNSDDITKVEAASIILDIIRRAKKEKTDYIDYIKDKDIDEQRLRNFSYLLLSGYSTESDILERIDESFKDIQEYDECEYIVYNGYKRDMTITKENKKDRVEILLDKSDITLDFPSNQHGFNIKKDNKIILRGQYHWKNKFQGIQTPCLNIFN